METSRSRCARRLSGICGVAAGAQRFTTARERCSLSPGTNGCSKFPQGLASACTASWTRCCLILKGNEPQDHNNHASPYRRSTGTWASRLGRHSVRRKLLHQPASFERRHIQAELHPTILSLQDPL